MNVQVNTEGQNPENPKDDKKHSNNVETAKALGAVLVTGGAGFVGQNFLNKLLDLGCKVRCFDVQESKVQHENLEVLKGDIRNAEDIEKAVQGIDTIFHTAAVINLKGGDAITKEYRDFSYGINVEGTKNLLLAAQKNGAKRFVYSSSNSVVIEGQPILNGTETLPYTSRFNDIYTETKVVAEQWVLAQDGKEGVHTCAIRPSGIWGPGDQTMFKEMFTQVIKGFFKTRVGSSKVKLDNTFVHNLIHGQILAAQNLHAGGTACGQAYFINDGEPVNVFEFIPPAFEAIGEKVPGISIPAWPVMQAIRVWQFLHFKIGFPEPPVTPLYIERVALDNYFSIAKAKKDLGYEPLYNTEQAMEMSLSYYKGLYEKLKIELA